MQLQLAELQVLIKSNAFQLTSLVAQVSILEKELADNDRRTYETLYNPKDGVVTMIIQSLNKMDRRISKQETYSRIFTAILGAIGPTIIFTIAHVAGFA